MEATIEELINQNHAIGHEIFELMRSIEIMQNTIQNLKSIRQTTLDAIKVMMQEEK